MNDLNAERFVSRIQMQLGKRQSVAEETVPRRDKIPSALWCRVQGFFSLAIVYGAAVEILGAMIGFAAKSILPIVFLAIPLAILILHVATVVLAGIVTALHLPNKGAFVGLGFNMALSVYSISSNFGPGKIVFYPWIALVSAWICLRVFQYLKYSFSDL